MQTNYMRPCLINAFNQGYLERVDMSRLIREMEKVVNFCGNFRFAGWASAGKFLANYVMMGFVLSQIARPFLARETYSARAEVYADNSGSLSICSVFPND